MYIIVGLGNPGREYQDTRHNMGYMALDILAGRWNIDIKRHNFKAVFGEGLIAGRKAVLAKPETYMNLSGWSVMELMNWYKPEHDRLIVIYDDIDLPAGSLRIRRGGSSGTHNGMKSIIYQLGYDDFPRIRVGIGQVQGDGGLTSHVLGAPQGEERELALKALNGAADAAELIVSGGIQEAQARFNKRKARKAGAEETELQSEGQGRKDPAGEKTE